MREIKFRGKRVDNGEWVFGWVSFQHNRAFIHSDDMPYDNAVEVDPATVGQFTGLKDKNGREIYEGDIVYIKHPEEIEGSIHQVIYCGLDNYPAFDLKPLIDTDCNGLSYALAVCEIEVIGNIHDNPELLEASV